jgi:alginate O-acetyltransferase complex protein AlgI
MLFNSYTFIFLFLPVAWIFFWVARGHSNEWGMIALSISSLFFYAYWDVRFLPVLLFSICANYFIAGQITTNKRRQQKFWLAFGITLNLGLLAFFKYMNFFSDISENLTGTPLLSFRILLPIGISFFTFQQITYLVDAFRGKSARYDLLSYTVFVSFFPQLISGPIVHHSEMMPQFLRSSRPETTSIAIGLSIFIAGLFKKLVLADNIAPFASAVFTANDAGLPVTFFETWGALIAFSFQMYFDFSGYCDMAIGLGLMFGIRLPINFNSPYRARSIQEYWQRWHITLGRFLRDYVYIPLGGSKVTMPRNLLNIIIMMFLSGMWHGAGWGFILWGLLNAFWLCLNVGMRRFNQALNYHDRSIIPGWFACIMTFWAVSFGWCFFKSIHLTGAMSMAKTALGFNGFTLPADFAIQLGNFGHSLEAIGLKFAGASHVAAGEWATIAAPMILMSFLIVWAMPNTNQLFLSSDPEYKTEPQSPFVWKLDIVGFTSIISLFFCAMLFASSISEFLYFQF